jgi:hypothetical protein
MTVDIHTLKNLIVLSVVIHFTLRNLIEERLNGGRRMNKETLRKANEIKEQIDALEHFNLYYRNTWEAELEIAKPKKRNLFNMSIETNPGLFDRRRMIVKKRLRELIREALNTYLDELYAEWESLGNEEGITEKGDKKSAIRA